MGGDLYGPDTPASSIDDEFYPEDYEVFGTTVNVRRAGGPSAYLWVDPDILKLKHRIGRGPFGDVWLATIHNSTEDFDEFHEVAVKMLPSDAEDHVRALLQKFETQFQQPEMVRGVSWPQGISVKNGKVSGIVLISHISSICLFWEEEGERSTEQFLCICDM